MSYLNCRHGDPCGDCNGYIGPLDTYVCPHACYDEARRPPDRRIRRAAEETGQ